MMAFLLLLLPTLIHEQASVRAPRRVRCLLHATIALLLMAISACGSSSDGTRAASARPVLAPYGAADAKLFDDAIDAAAVGLADVAVHPSTDPVLRARAQAAELSARVRVSTISADSAGGRLVYRVSLSVVDRLNGRLMLDHVELAVRPTSPSFGIVKWLDSGMIGKTFVAFFRRYPGADEPEIHFHLSPDRPEVATAVNVAKAFSDLRGK
jgi:hypothetical protein